MIISNELLNKYQMDKLEHYVKGFGEKEGTLAFCENFLRLTDHVPSKIFEAFIETMINDNVNIGSMKKFFKEAKTEYAEVLIARKQAREEINRIKADETAE